MYDILYTIRQIMNRKTLCLFNITLEEYNKLDPEVQYMLLMDYWNKQNKEEDKTKKLMLFNKKRY